MRFAIVKSTLLALSLFVTVQAQALEESESFEIKIDWNDKETLDLNVTQMCDDSYYKDVRITVPGKPVDDFLVETPMDITDGKAKFGCNVSIKKSAKSTLYIFDAVNGGCEIRVYKTRKDWKEEQKVGVYGISDAC